MATAAVAVIHRFGAVAIDEERREVRRGDQMVSRRALRRPAAPAWLTGRSDCAQTDSARAGGRRRRRSAPNAPPSRSPRPADAPLITPRSSQLYCFALRRLPRGSERRKASLPLVATAQEPQQLAREVVIETERAFDLV